jgi:hypothetical protein
VEVVMMVAGKVVWKNLMKSKLTCKVKQQKENEIKQKNKNKIK